MLAAYHFLHLYAPAEVTTCISAMQGCTFCDMCMSVTDSISFPDYLWTCLQRSLQHLAVHSLLCPQPHPCLSCYSIAPGGSATNNQYLAMLQRCARKWLRAAKQAQYAQAQGKAGCNRPQPQPLACPTKAVPARQPCRCSSSSSLQRRLSRGSWLSARPQRGAVQRPPGSTSMKLKPLAKLPVLRQSCAATQLSR